MTSEPIDRAPREHGSSFLLVFFLLALVSLLGVSLLATTGVDLRTSRSYGDAASALGDSDSAIAEVIYRLNLKPAPLPPPQGSRLSVNHLVNFDAAIRDDPHGLRSNQLDDDGDLRIDEPDELNLVRGLEVRIVLASDPILPAAPLAVSDIDLTTGPPFGSRFVVPTIQPSASWRPYTTLAADSPDVLLLRYKLDTDTVLGDSEGDGPEIVFHDPDLAADSIEDPNTLTALGGDGDPATDSPYNITWSDGTTTWQARGSPVLLVQATAHASRGGRSWRRSRVEAELVRSSRKAVTKALCGYRDLDLGGGGETASYRSSEGDYGVGPIYANGDVGSNGAMVIHGGGHVRGDADATLGINFNGSGATVDGDATAGGDIDGAAGSNVLGTITEHRVPPPVPCACNPWDIDQLLAAASLVNDNGSIVAIGGGSIYQGGRNLKLTSSKKIMLTGGTYFFDSIALSANARIQVGRDTNGDGVVDAPPSRPVRIYVAGDTNLGGQGVVNAGRPTDLQLYSGATPAAAVTINGGTEFRGFIYAPRTEVKISGGALFKGAALADEITTLGTSFIAFDEDLIEALRIPGNARILAWRERE